MNDRSEQLKNRLKNLENKKEDIVHHLAWSCEWGSFEYECYQEDLKEVDNEILKITGG